MADASGSEIVVLENFYYTSGVKGAFARNQSAPDPPALGLVRHQSDFGLGFYLAGMVDAGAGAGAVDFVVHYLGAGSCGADDKSCRERDRIEAFSRTRPGAGRAQAVAAIFLRCSIGMSGAAPQDFEAGED